MSWADGYNPDCLNSEHQHTTCHATGPFCWPRNPTTKETDMTTTLAQPFQSKAPATACETGCQQGVQIVPVAGKRGAFVVYHGMGNLDEQGHVTRTPIHLTFTEADGARHLHGKASA